MRSNGTQGASWPPAAPCVLTGGGHEGHRGDRSEGVRRVHDRGIAEFTAGDTKPIVSTVSLNRGIDVQQVSLVNIFDYACGAAGCDAADDCSSDGSTGAQSQEARRVAGADDNEDLEGTQKERTGADDAALPVCDTGRQKANATLGE